MRTRRYLGLAAACAAILAIGGCQTDKTHELPPAPSESGVDDGAFDWDTDMNYSAEWQPPTKSGHPRNGYTEIGPPAANGSDPTQDDSDDSDAVEGKAGPRPNSVRPAARPAAAYAAGETLLVAMAPAGERCDIAGLRLPQWQCDDLRAEIKEAQDRTLVLAPALPIYRGAAADVTLTLRRPVAGDPRPGGGAIESSGGDTSLAPVQATSWMRAVLTGAGFDIKPTSPADVPTGPTREAQWTWEVTALEGRPLTLTAIAIPLLKAEGVEVPYGPLSTKVEIDVKVKESEKWLDLAKLVDLQAREWAKALGALALFMAAAWGLWRAVRGRGAPAPTGKSGGDAGSGAQA